MLATSGVILAKNSFNYRDSMVQTFDIDDAIEQTRCRKQLEQLNDCLDEYSRDWRRCQEHLKQFRRCVHNSGSTKGPNTSGDLHDHKSTPQPSHGTMI